MFQSREDETFAKVQDHLIDIIDAREDPEDLRDAFKKHKGLIADLYKVFAKEHKAPQQHEVLEHEFVEAIIGDGPDQARVKIFGTILTFKAGPKTQLWTRFVSALRLASPQLRHETFRDACLPDFTLEYIQSQLGPEYASEFETRMFDFCPPDASSNLAEKLEELYNLVAGARQSYKTITVKRWPSGFGQSLEEKDYGTEGTGYFWPEAVALKLMEENKLLVQSIRLEHIKNSGEYRQASPLDRGRKLQECRASMETFSQCARKRAKIMAILSYSGASESAQAWDLLMQACSPKNDPSSSMLDEKLPYTPDDIRDIFGEHTPQNVLDIFYTHQYAFCPIKIRPKPDPINNIPLAHAHFPFLEKLQCGNGTSSDVFIVQVAPGHLQYKDSKRLNEDVEALAMKLMKFDKGANREVQVNNLISAQAFSHKHIIEVRGIEMLQDAVLIFMEPADCNLFEYMTQRCPSPASDVTSARKRLRMLTKIAHAMAHLHEHLEDQLKVVHFIHKDLKAENILVVPVPAGVDVDCDERTLKLTDFGLSSIKEESSSTEDRGLRTGGVQREASSRTKLPAYTPHFAPESSRDRRVTTKSDVWAFGTGLAELLAWIAKGADGLWDLQRSRKAETFWEVGDQQSAYLAPGVRRWFEGLFADETTDSDMKLMLADCWCVLEHVALVCDPVQRGSMRVVHDFLIDICKGKKDVKARIEAEFSKHGSDNMAVAELSQNGRPRAPLPDPAVTEPIDRQGGDANHDMLDRKDSLDPALQPTVSASSSGHSTGLRRPEMTTRAKWRIKNPFRSGSKVEASPSSSESNLSSARASPAQVDGADRQGTVAPNAPTSVQAPHGAIQPQGSRRETTGLHIAAARNDVEGLRRAFNSSQGRGWLEVRDNNGMTPLICALKQEMVEASAELLRHGADVNVTPTSRKSALHYAVQIPPTEEHGTNLAVMILERNPTLIARQGPGGNTALHILAERAIDETVGRLEAMFGRVEDAAREEALRIQNEHNRPPCKSLRTSELSSEALTRLRKLLAPKS